MIKSHYKVLGVMSGTSLDGIDLALIHFNFDNQWHFKLEVCATASYTKKWQEKLKNLVNLSQEELSQLDSEYTNYLAEIINLFLSKHAINDIDFISSHGHTALHQPDRGVTFQIGNQKKIANLTKQTIVCDFRTQDVAFGGQGAPLVPIGDAILFSDFEYCLNLGGFANISTNHSGKRIAYDICPANIVLNKFATKLGHDFDKNGEIAQNGHINSDLLAALNNLDFYRKKHPKSLGLEWVESYIFPLINSYNLKVPDVLRTFVTHIAMQIANQIKSGNVLITGGGVHNNFLIKTIKQNTNADLVIPNKKIVEFKEALIFGFLGVLRVRNEVNCLSSVTGAKRNHSSGKIYHP